MKRSLKKTAVFWGGLAENQSGVEATFLSIVLSRFPSQKAHTHLLQSRQNVVRVGLRYGANRSHLAVLLEATRQGLARCGHGENGQEQLPASQIAVGVWV